MPKFIPRVKKQKARARIAQSSQTHQNATLTESNTTEIVPESKSEREERRQRIKVELLASKPESKVSSQKRKRLDKYIDTKLRKEERLELIKKLEQRTGNTELLKSSKRLGRGHATKRETLQTAFLEREAGIDVAKNEGILFERRRHGKEGRDRSSEDEEDDAEDVSYIVTQSSEQPAGATSNAASSTAEVGSGLKRKLELDESGLPVLAKRTRKKGPMIKARWQASPAQVDEESEWEGFNSDSEGESAAADQSTSKVVVAGDTMTSTDDTHLLGDEHQRLEDVNRNFQENEESDDDTSDADEDATSEEGESQESDSSSLNDDDELDDDSREAIKEKQEERTSAFKAWATQMRNDAIGFQPSTNVEALANDKSRRQHDKSNNNKDNSATVQTTTKGKLPEVDKIQVEAVKRNIYNVTIDRSQEIQEARLKLPVVAEEQKIMEAVYNNDCVIIHGATGSGKTTQIPQFLLEAGFGSKDSSTPGMIGVTQPRRVAAVSMAKRVATELGSQGHRVSHQVRFDSTVDKQTAIKFMTDGVLLREVSQDFTLSKYSAILIDEAHERSVNTDILIGMLSRIVETRSSLSAKHPEKCRPLKLIIMSATLRLTDFTANKSLFRKSLPPIVQAEGRQHSVTIHWSRKTSRDYLEEAYEKISRGHKKLPSGGILVFLTGQNEIQHLRRRLLDTLDSTDMQHNRSSKDSFHYSTSRAIHDDALEEEDDQVRITGVDNDRDADDHDEENEFEIDGGNNSEEQENLKVHVLPLYSQLPTEQQLRVFDTPPDGSRLIVLATNVAETSLTIPGIRYVFDAGRAKERQYDRNTGVQTFDIDWISKASAEQRAGRAGRTGPGHCYRLYSSAVYENHFKQHAEPEILRSSIEGVVLQLKSMGIPKVSAFPFPTSPEKSSLLQAEKLLSYLGAIADDKITSFGNKLSAYPLSPRLAKIIVLAQDAGIVEHAISLVSVLAVPDLFIPESQLDLRDPRQSLAQDDAWTEADNQEARVREQRRRDYNNFHANCARMDKQSDAVKILVALCDFSADVSSPSFARFARVKAFHEAIQLRSQLAGIVNAQHPGAIHTTNNILKLPTTSQVKTLRHIMAAGYIDQVAIRADASPSPPTDTPLKPKRAIDVPYITLFPSSQGDTPKFVYAHASSILAHTATPQKMPTYLIYSHLSRSAPSQINSSKAARTRLHPLVPVTSEQLAKVAHGTPLIQEGKPVGRIESLPRGEDGKERRTFWSTPFLAPENLGEIGWPLPPARKVVQSRSAGRGWVTESVAE